ncbi:undecaprenyl-diphosphate phosphatase [Patescibacteria group bacterium]
MQVVQAIILGLIQGLTEFLPVSSSGHLVIAQSILGFESPGVLFESFLHAGTLLAILFFYRNTIMKLSARYLVLIGLGTIPAAFVGMLLKDHIEVLFNSTLLVGLMLIVTGFINVVIDKQTKDSSNTPSDRESILIGFFQALAIVPGISRSGATIFAARLRGIKKAEAAQFSFLLSVPAIIGANIVQLVGHGGEVSGNFAVLIFGFVSAMISGYLAIKLVLKYLVQSKFRYFGYYAIILGSIATILSII